MPVIEGRIEPRVEVATLLDAWNSRYGHEVAPAADLQTDGEQLTVRYSGSWNIQSLKSSIELEVYKINPGAVSIGHRLTPISSQVATI
jgi:hypothetical protein